MKSFAQSVICCLLITLSISAPYGDEQYLIITEEGQYLREIDVSSWQPGENFVYLFIDEGAYQP
jgi:hypothetical protein